MITNNDTQSYAEETPSDDNTVPFKKGDSGSPENHPKVAVDAFLHDDIARDVMTGKAPGAYVLIVAKEEPGHPISVSGTMEEYALAGVACEIVRGALKRAAEDAFDRGLAASLIAPFARAVKDGTPDPAAVPPEAFLDAKRFMDKITGAEPDGDLDEPLPAKQCDDEDETCESCQ